MPSDNPAKHFLAAFAIAVVGYFVAYQAIEHRRTRKGPWELTFASSAAAEPVMVVNQRHLGLTNVQLIFPGESWTNHAPATPMAFEIPREVPYEVGFGKCIFMDTTFLPGTLTFNFFGHEIELLPRVLVIDHEEHRWAPNERINISRTASKAQRP